MNAENLLTTLTAQVDVVSDLEVRLALARLGRDATITDLLKTSAPRRRIAQAAGMAEISIYKIAERHRKRSAQPVAAATAVSDEFVEASREQRYPLSRAGTRLMNAEARDVVATEGPILVDRLISIVGARFGLKRVQGSRRSDIRAALRGITVSIAPNGDEIAWPEGMNASTFTGVRSLPAGCVRQIDEVPYYELRNAIVDVVRTQSGPPAEDVIKLTAKRFGISRTGSRAWPRLAVVFATTIQEGVIRDEEGHLRAA